MKLTRFNSPMTLGHFAPLNDWFRHPFQGMGALSRVFDPEGQMGGYLATDVHEDQDHYYASFEVPGVKKENISIDLHERLLSVKVERKQSAEGEESSFVSTRSVSIPSGINAEAITAKLEDGVLTVTLPKSEDQKPRTIAVE